MLVTVIAFMIEKIANNELAYLIMIYANSQGDHGSGKTGKTGKIVNYFSLQGKIREFHFGGLKSGENQGISFC